MFDHIKVNSFCQKIINRLLNHSDFVVCTPVNRYYFSICHEEIGTKLRFDFRKIIQNGKLIGFRHVEINFNPHYHFNQYKHNGNDFSSIDCIKSIKEIFDLIGIQEDEYDELKVVNIEFGLNIILNLITKMVIDGLLYYSKTPFITPKDVKTPYYKISNTTEYKQIKGYAKGIHCQEILKIPEIDINTFRYEVKSKEAKYIKKQGIIKANDFFKIETYEKLSQTLIDEWEDVFILNLEPDFTILTHDEAKFIKEANNAEFWKELKTASNRNKFNRNKEKYRRILKGKNNLHHQIKLKIIDKLKELGSGANSTHRNPINIEKLHFRNTVANKINLESAPPHQISINPNNKKKTDEKNRKCQNWGCENDITNRRKGTLFCSTKCRCKYHREEEKTAQKLFAFCP